MIGDPAVRFALIAAVPLLLMLFWWCLRLQFRLEFSLSDLIGQFRRWDAVAARTDFGVFGPPPAAAASSTGMPGSMGMTDSAGEHQDSGKPAMPLPREPVEPSRVPEAESVTS
jgi:hypothetical protein